MAQLKILLDTNSYLRLAYTIHPLLFQEFGPDACCLYVLKELDDELNASHRLQTKFAWALQDEFVANRRYQLTASRKQKAEIATATSFIWDHVQTEQPGPSRIDVRHLAYGFVLKAPLVSDDRDLLAVARTFDIEVMKSIELLQLMLECEHISAQKLDALVAYWRYWQDTPSDLDEDFERIFHRPAPR